MLAFVLHAICVVQTVSLHKIASAMPTSVERDSNLRRLQRFLAGYALNLDLIAKVIFALLPVKTGLVLSLDRTNWKFGEVNINNLMLGVTHKGVAFPLLFTMLDKRGNSNWKERTRLIDRLIRRSVPSVCVPELQILICYNRPETAVATYKRRWQIETCFRAMKSSGFNIEDTHLRDIDRIARLTAMVCMALVWAYLVGEHKDMNVKTIRILKHGKRAKSLVKYSLEEIANVLLRPLYKPKFDIFKFLSCT